MMNHNFNDYESTLSAFDKAVELMRNHPTGSEQHTIGLNTYRVSMALLTNRYGESAKSLVCRALCIENDLEVAS